MPNNWKKYKFSDFVDINPTIRFSKDELYSFVEMKDLNESNKFTLPSTEKKVTGGARFEERDTLFARITPCLQNGKICQVKGLRNGVGFGSTEFLIFRGKKGISDTDFVYYLSRESGVRKFAEQSMIGTSGRQRVVKDAFQNLELELPPLPEQRAIAEILSALDDKIELNLQTNKTLEEMANALYKHWFVDFGPFLPKGRCLQDGGGPIPGFVESELGMIPEGLTIKKLEEIIKFTKGKKPENISMEDQNGFLPQILISSFDESHSGYASVKNMVIAADLDLLMVMDGSGSGRTEIGFPGIVGSTISRIDIKEQFDFLRFVTYLILRSNQKLINENTTGTSIPHADKNFILNLTIPVPSKEVIEIFNSQIKSFIQLTKSNLKENRTLKQSRDYLLPKLISGEVRVKNAVKKVKEVI